MKPVQDAFDRRVAEIDLYLRTLHALEEPHAQLHFPDRKSHRFKPIDPDWIKTLKATTFLLLYNLVESSIREGMGAVYEQVQIEGCTMETVESQLLRIWVDQQYSGAEKDSATLKTYREKCHDLIDKALAGEVVDLDRSRLPISGNLDAQKIRDVCRKHGVSVKVHRAALGGHQLTTVKDKRNALAHGDESFAECGRQFTVSDLEEMKRQAVIFIRGVLRNIEKYLDKKAFRK